MKAEVSIPVGLATAVMVYGMHQNATPPLVDVRAAPPHDQHISGAERQTTWTAAAAVSAISLIARDPVVFWFGSAAIIAMAWMTRHANAVDPRTGGTTMPMNTAPMQTPGTPVAADGSNPFGMSV